MLGKRVYKNPELLYKYKGVPIPNLRMVDDILSVTNVENIEIMNKLVHTFIESKNLDSQQKMVIEYILYKDIKIAHNLWCIMIK